MFEKYTFIIGEHFLPALINGDDTGLSEWETTALDLFAADVTFPFEHSINHWAYDDDEPEFSFCEVTQERGMCVRVHLMVRHLNAA